jgi:hypothetical protein
VGDYCLFAARFDETGGGSDLWPHAAGRKVSFGYVPVGFFYGYMVQFLLVGLAEVYGGLFYVGEYHQAVGT